MAESPRQVHRLPARPGATRPALRRARPGRTARLRRAANWALPTRSPGTGLTSARSSRKRATPSASRRSSSTSPRPGAGRPVQDHRDPVRGGDPPRQRAGLAPGRALLPHRARQAGTLVGQFYLDQPARAGKRGGAWMDDVRARWLRPDTGTLQTPVAHLVCNFADGVGGKPRAADARRRDHPVPRVRPRPAPHADPGERARRLGHQRRGMGRGGTAQPVHGELLLGMGRAAST